MAGLMVGQILLGELNAAGRFLSTLTLTLVRDSIIKMTQLDILSTG